MATGTQNAVPRPPAPPDGYLQRFLADGGEFIGEIEISGREDKGRTFLLYRRKVKKNLGPRQVWRPEVAIEFNGTVVSHDLGELEGCEPGESRIATLQAKHNKIIVEMDCFIEPLPAVPAHTEKTRFQIIAPTVATGKKCRDCQILPENAVYPATHSRVYGPASKTECQVWVKANCQ